MPRIKIDLTAHERLVLPPVLSPIFHPYSDAPDDGIVVYSYAYQEAFAEKVRALVERARPRDLYDVVNLFRNGDARPEVAVLRDVLVQKCAYKGIAMPELAQVEPSRAELEGGWQAMLAHQLPALPSIETFWEVLPEFFAWLEGAPAPQMPVAYVGGSDEETIHERTQHVQVPGATRTHLEIIRFAASNRLCVDLDYQGSTRRIEPYSLRRTRAGDIILHAHNVDRNAHRGYRVDRIRGARITNQVFTPRYAVELTPKE